MRLGSIALLSGVFGVELGRSVDSYTISVDEFPAVIPTFAASHIVFAERDG